MIYLPSNHMHILEMLIVRTSFDDKDFDIAVFRQSTGDDTP